MIARFINPDTIVYTACDKPNNPNYENLAKLEAELFKLQSTELNNIKLVPLYIPEAIYNKNHELLPASYVNFLIINDAILVPTYKSKKYDQLALASFSKLAPNRAIIGINSEIAITQGGSLHCLTMQIPAAF
jgi:agmatine deiminase